MKNVISLIKLDKLPPECEYGCVEYKRQLTDISEERRNKLIGQMLWRIHEGGGWCIYFLGVKDNGEFWNNESDFNTTIKEFKLLTEKCGATIMYELPVSTTSRGFVIQRNDYDPNEFDKMFRKIE